MKQTSIRFRVKVILASLANLFVLSYLDYLTDFQFLIFVFFFIPVALCGWYLGRPTVVSMAILSGITWCLVDTLADHQYPAEIFRYLNSLICFLAFASIGLLVQGLRRSLSEESEARRNLEAAMEELKQRTGEIQKLQGQLQVVCAWTKRINVEGKWIALDEFLTEKLRAKVTYGVSPEAMQEVLKISEGPDPAAFLRSGAGPAAGRTPLEAEPA